MVFGVARSQASVERWGRRALPPPEGTRAQSYCQCGQPSTSTFGLRVAAGDRALRHSDVEIRRPARGGQREARNDAVRDLNLQPQIDGCAEADLEATAQPERDLAVERTHEGHASGEAAADERRQRTGGE